MVMRVNIEVTFAVVEEIAASDHSVDLADLEASEMGPGETADAVVATIQDAARRARGKGKQPEPAASAGGDYPLDPNQD
jgi:hypothetical protein